ncbi:unnamed protein product, partial [Laminaria digitata]
VAPPVPALDRSSKASARLGPCTGVFNGRKGEGNDGGNDILISDRYRISNEKLSDGYRILSENRSDGYRISNENMSDGYRISNENVGDGYRTSNDNRLINVRYR